MTVAIPGLRAAWRELVNSRSVAASAVRVCGMVVLAQFCILLVRIPLQRRASSPLVPVNTDPTAVYRNGTFINTKALVSLLSQLMLQLAERAAAQLQPLADADQLHTPAGEQLLRRISRQQVRSVRATLVQVVPEAIIIGDDDDDDVNGGSHDEDGSVDSDVVLPPPELYRTDVHKVVLFDQWLPSHKLTVWISPLHDSMRDVRSYKLKMVTMSVCVSYQNRPHLTVIVYPFPASTQLYWGLYGRGNGVGLNVAQPKGVLPERFGINIDRRSDNATYKLVRRAFDEDPDVYEDGSVAHQLGAVGSGLTDAAVYKNPVPLRQLCAPHVLLRLYGGRVTDFSGTEVVYENTKRRSPALLLAALFFHKHLLNMLNATVAGSSGTLAEPHPN